MYVYYTPPKRYKHFLHERSGDKQAKVRVFLYIKLLFLFCTIYSILFFLHLYTSVVFQTQQFYSHFLKVIFHFPKLISHISHINIAGHFQLIMLV